MLADDFTKLLHTPEDLHPDLADHVNESSIPGMDALHHPLMVHVPYFSAMNALINRQYARKLEAIEEYRSEQRWVAVLGVFERPYRCETLLEILQEHPELTRDEAAEMVGYVWIDSENIYECRQEWHSIWHDFFDFRPDDFGRKAHHRTSVFKETKGNPLHTVKVYRGFNLGDENQQADCLSWTTCRKSAEWFARRWEGREGASPRILEGYVAYRDILATFDRGSENEVVVCEGKVFDWVCTELD